MLFAFSFVSANETKNTVFWPIESGADFNI